MTTTPVLSQSHFRGRSDAGTIDATPTWIANEDTNWTQLVGVNFRIRFTVQETAGGNPAAATVKLQSQKNADAYQDVTASSTNVKAVDAGSSAEDASIATQRLSGTGTYVAGRYSEDGSPASTVNLAASQNTEWEFGIVINAAEVAEADTIKLKVVELSGTAITATVVPTVTVAKNQTLTPSLYDDGDTFFSPTVGATYALTAALYTDDDTFYSPTVAATYALLPALYADDDTFYSPTVVGAQTLEPSLYTDSDTFFSPTVAATYSLLPSLYDDGDTFFSPTVSATYALLPSLYDDGDTFLSPTVGATYALTPSLYDDGDTFYSPTVSASGAQNLTPSLYSDGDTFYVATVTGGDSEQYDTSNGAQSVVRSGRFGARLSGRPVGGRSGIFRTHRA